MMDTEVSMASMNVSVPDPMRDWVQSRIDSGQYASVSDYVRDLIRKDQAAAAGAERWLATLDASVMRGIADVEAGRTKPAEEVFDRLGAKYAALEPAPKQP
jgi:antitoxin ParD1/3/4